MDNQEKTLASDYNFRKSILGLRSVKIRNFLYCVEKIDDLHITNINEDKSNKTFEFEASAEFYFKTKFDDGFISSGNRLEFTGKVQKSDNQYSLSENVILKEEINCSNYKVCDDDELS